MDVEEKRNRRNRKWNQNKDKFFQKREKNLNILCRLNGKERKNSLQRSGKIEVLPPIIRRLVVAYES